MNKSLKKIWNVISSILVALVVLLALLLVGARVVGLQVFTVLSGSMEPTYHTGSLIYVKKVDPYTITDGQPITFMLDENAKFEYDVADLTITKQGWEDIDENQSFLFDVTGPNGYSQRVVIKGNGSVTIKGLKIGEYTVTEVTNWSWRYTTTSSSSQNITLQPAETNEVTFKNTRSKDRWLGGDAYKQNIFKNIFGN